tara:strand:- start:1486 stop:2205 length:720 start_codon:yes stop_codon:yes gene_type:complete
MFAWVWRAIKRAVNAAIDALFRAVFGGVMRMIENFKRIVCFLESLPLRARNVTSGVQNIFEGVGKKVEAIGKSFSLGFERTGTLVEYTGEYAETRIECVTKFIKNFYKCALFYLIRIFCEIMYAIITLPVIYVSYLFGVDANKVLFTPIAEGMTYISSYFGFDIIFYLKYLTEGIHDDCYSCRRLKDSALENAGKRWQDTFTKDIPKIMKDGGAKEFRRAKNQFNESSVLIPREPHLVH